MEQEHEKAVIYCRVSSEKQVKEGNGLDSQEHRCRDYASSLGLDVEQVFRDEGISGGLFERPALISLIKYLDDNWQNKYTVIFDDLKRFARDVSVHLKLRSELKAREAKLRCLNYNFDDSAEGEFVETIFAAQNELERKQNRRQVCQKMKARIERGYWCFNPPTGYRFEKDKEHGKLLFPIKKITTILAQGLTDFAEDRLLSQSDLKRFLEENGLPRLIGKDKLYLFSIKRLLTEPLYAGIIQYSPWGISKRKGHHKAIISEMTYYRIQKKISRPERLPRETDSLEFPLRRFVDCACCGKPMTGSSSKSSHSDKYYPHYTCNNKDCVANPKNITASKVEDDYLGLLSRIGVDDGLLPLAKETAMNLWQQKINGFSKGTENVQVEIEEVEGQINTYMDLVSTAKSASLRARYEEKIEALDQKIAELKGNLEKLENKKEPNFEEALNLTLRLLGTPAETWKNADREQKIMVQKLIFEENPKYSHKNGFGTPKLSLPFYINNILGLKNSSDFELVEVRGVAPLSNRLRTYFLQA